ncbi:MAG: hypothetical protein IJD48_00460 [Clostridia bacterium]|nr:hypothetical protein [Clostridia bacterium]
MEIKDYNGVSLCFGCKQKLTDGFEIDLDKRFFNNIKICKNCAKLLYFKLGQKLIPKSPKNIFNEFKNKKSD